MGYSVRNNNIFHDAIGEIVRNFLKRNDRMLELELELMRRKPLYYKIMKVFIYILSAITVLIYIILAVMYVTSGPMQTLADDITFEFLFKFIILAIGLLFMLFAWKYHITCALISAIFIVGYITVNSLDKGMFSMGFMEVALLILCLLFVAFGFLKRWLEDDGHDKILGPDIEKNDGPDITKFTL